MTELEREIRHSIIFDLNREIERLYKRYEENLDSFRSDIARATAQNTIAQKSSQNIVNLATDLQEIKTLRFAVEIVKGK